MFGGSRGSGSGRGSDALSWRKPMTEDKLPVNNGEEESKASSPMKLLSGSIPSVHAKRLTFADEKERSEEEGEDCDAALRKEEELVRGKDVLAVSGKEVEKHMNNAM